MGKKTDDTAADSTKSDPKVSDPAQVSNNKDKIQQAKDELKAAADATGRENIVGDISTKNPDPRDPDEVKSFLKEVRDMVKELFEDHKAKKAKDAAPTQTADPTKTQNHPPPPTAKKAWYDRELI